MVVQNEGILHIFTFEIPNTQSLIAWYSYKLVVCKQSLVYDVIMRIKIRNGCSCKETEHINIVILGGKLYIN